MRRSAVIAIAAATVVVLTTSSPGAGSTHQAGAQPSGGKIAFVRTGEHGRDIGEIYVINADGSGERNLTGDPSDDQRPVWSPDGSRLAYVSQRSDGRNTSTTNIYIVDAGGGTPRQLTRSDWSDSPVWSAQGRRIAFIRRFLDPPRNLVGNRTKEIFVINADGSRERRLTRNRLEEFDVAWSRAGKLAFVRAPRLEPRNWTGAEIFVMNPDGSGVRRITRNQRYEYGLAWSPDGRKLAFFQRTGSGTPGSALVVMDARSGAQRRLVSAARRDSGVEGLRPVWSPNGNKIAYNWGPNADIYVINADGTGRRRVAANMPSLPTWSPDGRKLAFSRHPGIHVTNADGSGQRRLVPPPGAPPLSLGENWSPAWSPHRR
jgi:TolB protein